MMMVMSCQVRTLCGWALIAASLAANLEVCQLGDRPFVVFWRGERNNTYLPARNVAAVWSGAL